MGAVARALVTGVLYVAAARYSVLLQDLEGLGAVFWPGAGITVTALLVSPRRAWPAILVAVGVAEAVNDLLLGFGLSSSLWWALGNTIEPLLAASLMLRWGAQTLQDVSRAVRFVLATLVATAVGGLLGAIGTNADVTSLPYAVTAFQWMIGDGLGILTVVPFGLVLFGRIASARLLSAEGVLAIATVLLATVVVFAFGSNRLVSDYLLLPPMVWAAVRFRVAGAAVALFVTAQVANAYNALGSGPFSVGMPSDVAGSVQLQLFLAVTGVTALLLACRTLESKTFHDLAETREQLIAAVSHELRTPLTPIVGFSELLLRDQDLDRRARQGLEAIHRNARHLTDLVEDLLRASRARHGILPLHPEPIGVRELLVDLLADRPGDAISVTTDDPERAVLADRTHLVQIVTNLLDNALRHGRPPVVVEVTGAGDVTRLVVADAGEGVPDWFVPNLFDEFAQATSGDQRASIGLGLGLPIARTLAVANGGDLRYEAGEPGARFVLLLPSADDRSHAP